jgi:hypothetical protein
MTSLPALPDVPFVSVYTCVYNHERFVAEAIESVLAEDWPADRMEYVVIDDGSTDGSPAAVEPYLDRIRYIRQENQGVRPTVNRVVDELRGDLVVSVAGDDAWPAGRLHRLVELMQRNPAAGLGYSDLEVIDAGGATIHPSFYRMSNLTPHSGRIRGRLLANNCVSGGGVILRGCLKDVWHPVPGHAAWEDWWWAWAVSGVADIVYLDEPTYRYRQHGANISLGATGARWAASMRVDLRFRRWMLNQIAAGEASPEELVLGVLKMDAVRMDLERDAGDAAENLLPVSDADERRTAALIEEGAAAQRRGDPLLGLFLAVRAIAADPLSREPRELLAAIVPDARGHVLHGAVSPRRPAPVALDTRSFVVLADAAELVARPELLRGFAARFGAGDDATLVIHGPDWTPERLGAEVGGLVASLSLDTESAPDMLAIGSETPASAASARASAVLGTGAAGGPPAFDAAAVDGLRSFAEAHWGTRRSAPA